ncbi:MAG: hypothetical protein KDD69_18500 [Bdellovibrionales bacterium]|nr:hypothetical protein [Bdellovibrionales bacterium]
MDDDKGFRRKDAALLLLFFLGIGFYFLPVLDIAFNSARPVLGIPLSILWLFCCTCYLVGLVVMFSRIHFSSWVEEVDSGRSA